MTWAEFFITVFQWVYAETQNLPHLTNQLINQIRPHARRFWRQFLELAAATIIIPVFLICLDFYFKTGWPTALAGMLLAGTLTVLLFKPVYIGLSALIGVVWELSHLRVRTAPDIAVKFGESYLRIVAGILLWELIICVYLSFVPIWTAPTLVPKVALLAAVLALTGIVWGLRGVITKRLIVGIVGMLFIIFTISFFIPKTSQAVKEKGGKGDEKTAEWVKNPQKPSWWPDWLSGKPADSRPLAGTFEVSAIMVAPTKNPDGTWKMPVPANELSIDSTLEVQKGERVEIVASGQANGCKNKDDAAYGWTGPEGWNFFWDKKRKRPLPGFPFMMLCARIGDGAWFSVGSKKTFFAPQNGRLLFTVNDEIYDEAGRFRLDWRRDNEGKFEINVKIGG